MIGSLRRFLAVTTLAGLVAACGESLPTAPGATPGGDASSTEGGQVSFSVAIGSSAGISAASMPAFDVELGDDAGNFLVLTRVAMVLREVELELQNDDGCDDSSRGGDDSSSGGDDSSDDGCEKIVAGPFLLELPLDGAVETIVTLEDVTPGVYDELEFDFHKPEDDTAEDLAFIQQHPDFRRVSIRVEGEYNGDAFLYETDLNEDQEVDLAPPLVVSDASNQTNVTLMVNVDSWFRRASGALVNPASANKGGPNEKLVEDNIEDSIEGFEDEDFDGDED